FLFQPKDAEPDAQIEDTRKRLEPILKRRLAGTLKSLQITNENGIIRARATIEAPTPADLETIKTLEVDLRKNINPRIQLTVATNLIAG
ncbi:MAG: hypothetical protein ABIV13_01305, partial [Fimbriimonadales bacterium]